MAQVEKLIVAARSYQQRGIVCVPTRPGYKHPAIIGWSDLTSTPYDDFHKAGYNNKTGKATMETVAMHIMTGKVSNLVCVDIDDCAMWKNILAYYELIGEDVDFSKVIQETTPSGGYHYYFTYTDNLQRSVNKCIKAKKADGTVILIDIDVKSNGGISLCAPSLYTASENKPEKKQYNNTPYKWVLSPEDAEWKDGIVPRHLIASMTKQEIEQFESTKFYHQYCPRWLEDLLTGFTFLKLDSNDEITTHLINEDHTRLKTPKETKEKNDDDDEPVYKLASLAEISNGLAFLDICKFSDRASWQRVIWSVARGVDQANAEDADIDDEEVIDLLDEWSAGDTAQYSGKVAVSKMYIEATKSKALKTSRITYGTFRKLVYEEKNINRKREKVELKEAIAESKKVTAPFSDDNYVWEDFVTECKSEIFSSKDIAVRFVAERINKVLALLSVGKTTLLKKDSIGIISRISELGENCFNVKYKTVIVDQSNRKTKNPDKEVIVKYSLSDIIKEEDVLKRYILADFYPDVDNCPERTFNLWRGPIAKYVPKSEERDKLVEPILNLLKTAYASTKDKKTGVSTYREMEYLWLLSYFRTMLIKPWEKLRICLFLYSKEEGTGKNSFVDWFGRRVLGDHLCTTLTGLDAACDKFNVDQEGKLLMIVNELAAGSAEVRNNMEKMKDIITNARRKIELKGLNKYEVNCFINAILTSNHNDSLYISKYDRRYGCYEIDNIYLNNEEFWTDYKAKVENQDVANAFYSYLLDLDPSTLPSCKKVPKTPLRATMIAMKRNTTFAFIEELVHNQNIYRIKGDKQQYRYKWSSDELYAEYSRWSAATGSKFKKSKDAFYKDINDGDGNGPLLEKKKISSYFYIIPVIDISKEEIDEHDDPIDTTITDKIENQIAGMDDSDAQAVLDFITKLQKDKLSKTANWKVSLEHVVKTIPFITPIVKTVAIKDNDEREDNVA